jgi:hypothetical protein
MFDSRSEHITIETQMPLNVSEVAGRATSKGGEWPDGIKVLVEVRSRDTLSKVFQTTPDRHGDFRFSGFRPGLSVVMAKPSWYPVRAGCHLRASALSEAARTFTLACPPRPDSSNPDSWPSPDS